MLIQAGPFDPIICTSYYAAVDRRFGCYTAAALARVPLQLSSRGRACHSRCADEPAHSRRPLLSRPPDGRPRRRRSLRRRSRRGRRACPRHVAKAIAAELERARFKPERDRVHHLALDQGRRGALASPFSAPARPTTSIAGDSTVGSARRSSSVKSSARRGSPSRRRRTTRRAARRRRSARRCGSRFRATASMPSRRATTAARRARSNWCRRAMPPRSTARNAPPRSPPPKAPRIARDLGNTPPNVATPDWMAARARDDRRPMRGMKATVYDARRAAQAGDGRPARGGRGLEPRAAAGAPRVGTARPASSRWSARASPSTPAASRSSRPPTWTR